MFGFLATLLVYYGLISLGTYLIPFIIHTFFFPPQDLKKKYAAEWALVTGASSGIGREISERLAQQGVNVVLAALADELLETTFKELTQTYKKVKFVKCGCNLGGEDYMEAIVSSTSSLPINLVFNNAGFIITSFFADIPLEKVMANYNCNATSVVKITHHFLNTFKKQKFPKSAIIFTSSPSNLIPNPTSAIYGATKAFVTEFATSVAPEVKVDGVDILVVHPSPVASGFWKQAKSLQAINFFKQTATGPQKIVNAMFSSVGRTTVRDEGYFPLCVKLLTKILDYNLFSDIITSVGRYTSDFKLLQKAK